MSVHRTFEAFVAWAFPWKLSLTLAVVLGVLGVGESARATPDFPGAVDMYLKLAPDAGVEQIDPPDGCRLCHINESGNTPFTEFGTLMEANGAVDYEATATAPPALAQIQATDPQYITDLKNGMDPNLDHSNPNADPIPQYGCGSVAAGSTPRGWPCMVLASLGLFAGLVRRRAVANKRRS